MTFLRSFLTKRLRRLIGYTASITLSLFVAVAAQMGEADWFDLSFALQLVLESESGTELVRNLQYFFLVGLAPIAIFLAIVIFIALLMAFLASLIAVTLIPPFLTAFLDGALLILPFLVGLETLLVGEFLRQSFGTYAALPVYILIFLSFSTLLWRRVPIGLSSTSQARRTLSVPIEHVTTRLIPSPRKTDDYADQMLAATILDQTPTDVSVTKTGLGVFEILEADHGRFPPTRKTIYKLSEQSTGQTELELTVHLAGLAPLEFWDVWTRPFAEDFADHLVARLNKSKDRSIYGRFARRYLKKHASALSELQPA